MHFVSLVVRTLLKIPAHNQDIMSSIKLLLYKSLDWSYEQEWRLINSVQKDLFTGRTEPVIIKPNSIYYGSRIPHDKYTRLHEIAVEKGLEEHYMIVDNAISSYTMRVSH